MSLPPSTSLFLAATSWVVDLLAQVYGMTTKPNVKDVHESNMSFYSPNATMIASFFFPQQLVQLGWLYILYTSVKRVKSHGASLVSHGNSGKEMDRDRDQLQIMLDYVPFYALGNFCIAGWMFFWVSSSLLVANVLVAINSLSQLYYLHFVLPRLSLPSTQALLTHLNVKTIAGISVLDLLHNTSVVFYNHQRPFPAAENILGVVFFALALSAGDWMFGACLVYDLLALVLGQFQLGNEMYAIKLGVYAGGVLIVVVLRNVIRPPYTYQEPDYRPL